LKRQGGDGLHSEPSLLPFLQAVQNPQNSVALLPRWWVEELDACFVVARLLLYLPKSPRNGPVTIAGNLVAWPGKEHLDDFGAADSFSGSFLIGGIAAGIVISL
jgi:hypothetical protein